jgi:hypothetical protein
MLYDLITAHTHPLYNPPDGHVVLRFLLLYCNEFIRVWHCDSNSDCNMIFLACILCHETDITRCKDINARVTKWMNLWEQGHVLELVQCTAATASHGTGGRQSETDNSIAKKYHSIVPRGKLRAAIRMVTGRSGGVFS